MTRLLMLALLAFVLATGAGFGCYTMIRHPQTDMTSGDAVEDRTCMDCHSDADYSHWTDPYYTSFYSFYPSTWGSYYLHPWWSDRYWGPGGPPSNGEPVEQGGRHAWDRGPGSVTLPPGSGDVPSIGGHTAPIPGGGGPRPAAADTSRARRQDTEKAKEREKQKDQEKRHGWRR